MRALFAGWFTGIMMGYSVCGAIYWNQIENHFGSVDRIIMGGSLMIAFALTYMRGKESE